MNIIYNYLLKIMLLPCIILLGGMQQGMSYNVEKLKIYHDVLLERHSTMNNTLTASITMMNRCINKKLESSLCPQNIFDNADDYKNKWKAFDCSSSLHYKFGDLRIIDPRTIIVCERLNEYLTASMLHEQGLDFDQIAEIQVWRAFFRRYLQCKVLIEGEQTGCKDVLNTFTVEKNTFRHQFFCDRFDGELLSVPANDFIAFKDGCYRLNRKLYYARTPIPNFDPTSKMDHIIDKLKYLIKSKISENDTQRENKQNSAL